MRSLKATRGSLEMRTHVVGPVSGSWVVVQNAEDVEGALALERARSGSLAFLATSAEAYFALKEREVPCRSTHEFTSRESTNEIARENFENVKRLTLRLDEIAHVHIPDLPDGFKPFEAIESDFKKVADSVSFAFAELSGFCRAEAPDEILYWDDSQETATQEEAGPEAQLGAPIRFEPATGNQSFASRVLAEKGWWAALGAEVQRLSSPEQTVIPRQPKRLRQRVRERLNPNRTEAVRLLGSTISAVTWRRGAPRLLVIGKTENLLSFLKYAVSSRKVQIDWWAHDLFAPVHLPTLGRVRLNGASDNGFRQMGDLGSVLRRPDVDGADEEGLLEGVLLERLSAFWRWRLPRLESLYNKAIEYFESQRPIGVVCGSADTDLNQVIRQAATASGIPLVSFQHGGSYGYMECEWVKLSDLRADIYAGFGPKGSAYLEGFAKGHRLDSAAVGVGWARGASLGGRGNGAASVTRAASGRKVVMYAPTGLGQDFRYGPDHRFHDTDYCLKQQRVVQALLQVPDIHVAIKLHPKDAVVNPVGGWARQLGDPRVRVLEGQRLPEALRSADLVVLDCPTTSLLEVMATGLPLVYLHLGILRWTPEGEAVMRRTAPWVEHTDGWEERLRQAVAETLESPAPEPRSNRFLNDYASLDFQPKLLWDKLGDVRSRLASGVS